MKFKARGLVTLSNNELILQVGYLISTPSVQNSFPTNFSFFGYCKITRLLFHPTTDCLFEGKRFYQKPCRGRHNHHSCLIITPSMSLFPFPMAQLSWISERQPVKKQRCMRWVRLCWHSFAQYLDLYVQVRITVSWESDDGVSDH